MKRRVFLAGALLGPTWLAGCASFGVNYSPVGTGDLGVVIQRAKGRLSVVNTSTREVLGEVQGLGDLSHASVVFSRDARFAYVFGRDGGLTKVNILTRAIEGRVM